MTATRTPRAPQVIVEITDEVIDEAIPRDSSHCMIADALKALVPGASKVAVDLQTIRFSDLKKGLRYTYLTPRVAQVALIKFDQGLKPEPFAFRLRGGQVTRAGRVKRETKPLSEKQMQQRKDAASKVKESLGKTQLAQRHAGSGRIPDRIGGQPPP